jgi:hypothetical protein
VTPRSGSESDDDDYHRNFLLCDGRADNERLVWKLLEPLLKQHEILRKVVWKGPNETTPLVHRKNVVPWRTAAGVNPGEAKAIRQHVTNVSTYSWIAADTG